MIFRLIILTHFNNMEGVGSHPTPSVNSLNNIETLMDIHNLKIIHANLVNKLITSRFSMLDLIREVGVLKEENRELSIRNLKLRNDLVLLTDYNTDLLNIKIEIRDMENESTSPSTNEDIWNNDLDFTFNSDTSSNFNDFYDYNDYFSSETSSKYTDLATHGSSSGNEVTILNETIVNEVNFRSSFNEIEDITNEKEDSVKETDWIFDGVFFINMD